MKTSFRNSRGRLKLALALLVVLVLVSGATALMIIHDHTQTGFTEYSTAFTPTYDGDYADGVRAPALGSVAAWVTVELVQTGNVAANDGDLHCHGFRLTDTQHYSYTFWSAATITSGTARGAMWDKYEKDQPILCPSGEPN